MTRTISSHHALLGIVSVLAFVAYMVPMLIGCYVWSDDPMAGAITGSSLFTWTVLAVQVAAAVAYDDMVMGKRPVVFTGPAIIVNLAMCGMTVVAQDQHDVSYALIGMMVGITAIAIMAMKRK